MKKGIIIWIIILIALWAAWSRYYIKNNWEKIIDYWNWASLEYTLKRWKLEWEYKETEADWTIWIRNFKNWEEDWEEINYYPNWNIRYKMIRKEWRIDRTKEATAYYEDWSYRRISNPEWNVSYYENWQIEDKYNKNSEGDIIWIRKWYNEEWELIAEWEYKDWKKYNWTFVYKIQWYDANDEYYKTIYIEEYKNWEFIDKQLYED
jgi:hypothetical protein